MKKIILLIAVLSLPALGFAQVAINTTGNNPATGAGLDIDFTNYGLLIPRVALSSTASNAPIGAGLTTSLLVYNTAMVSDVTPGYYYWNGTNWVRFLVGKEAWMITGNDNITAPTVAVTNPIDNNFIGTTNAIDVAFASNGYERMRIKSVANGDGVRIGIGTSFATSYPSSSVTTSLLHVYDGGATANDYAQLQLGANKTTATNKVGELNFHSALAAADRRTASIESYVTGVSGLNPSGDLRFFTNNSTTATFSEKMRIQGNGNVGINNTAPEGKLEVSGTTLLNSGSANLDGAGIGFLANSAKLLIGWNRSSGGGETNFITNRGAGSTGGFRFSDYTNLGILNDLVTIQGSGNVGIGTTAPDLSAILEINSSSKGVLLTRVALTATNTAGPIANPATSLLVYNTATSGIPPYNVIPGFYYNAGTPAAPNWVLLGKTGSRFTVHYDNRFRVSAATLSNYFYNSQNYGPGTEGDNTYPYRNDYLSSYYTANPASISSAMAIWQSTYKVTSQCYLTGFDGWAMVENNYNGVTGTIVTNPPTVTVYFYKYTPTNASGANIAGTLVAQGSVTLSYTYYTYQISFTPSSAIVLNPGDFIIGYVRSSTQPSVSGTNCIMTLIGELEFEGL